MRQRYAFLTRKGCSVCCFIFPIVSITLCILSFYKAEGLWTHMLTHGVTKTCNTYHASLYGYVLDDSWASVIKTQTCNSDLTCLSDLLFENTFEYSFWRPYPYCFALCGCSYLSRLALLVTLLWIMMPVKTWLENINSNYSIFHGVELSSYI